MPSREPWTGAPRSVRPGSMSAARCWSRWVATSAVREVGCACLAAAQCIGHQAFLSCMTINPHAEDGLRIGGTPLRLRCVTIWETKPGCIAREERRAFQDRRDALTRVGLALYGVEWVSPIARDLGVALRTAQRWAAGDVPVPLAVVEGDLRTLVASQGPRRLADLRAGIATIESFGG